MVDSRGDGFDVARFLLGNIIFSDNFAGEGVPKKGFFAIW